MAILFALAIIVSSVSLPLQYVFAEITGTTNTYVSEFNRDSGIFGDNVNTNDTQRVDPPNRSTVLISQGYWILINGNYKFKLYSTNAYLTSSWINDNGTYYYVGSDGYMYKYLKTIGSYKYYFNGAGAMMTGFITFNEGKRYFDSSDGKMHVGWLEYATHEWYYFNSNGLALTYLQTIGDYQYYFNGAGVMLMGWVQFGDNGYRYFEESNDSGKMLTGWQTIDGNRYYLGSDGYRYTYYCLILNDHYYFNGNGVMQTGWIQMNNTGEWYHFGENGKLTKYTVTENGNRYCYYPGGTMITGWLIINGDYYYFGNNGAMVYYQQVIEGDHYYFTSEGKMYKGWLLINGNYYYYDTNGKRVTGWKEIAGYWYHLANNGVMDTYWFTDDGSIYYLGSDGKMRTAWQTIGSSTYYFGNDGAMYTYLRTIGSYKYYFGSDGKKQTGWIYMYDNCKWYYFDASTGRMHIGWLQYEGDWYYLETDGTMCIGNMQINFHDYYFNDSGKMTINKASIVRESQIGSNTCWAACSLMAGSYKNNNNITQLDIIINLFGYNANSTAGKYEVVDSIEYAANGNKNAWITTNNSFSDLKNRIDDSCVTVTGLLFGPNYTYGHMIVCSGYRQEYNDQTCEDIYIIDPNPNVPYPFFYSYSELMDGQLTSGIFRCYVSTMISYNWEEN